MNDVLKLLETQVFCHYQNFLAMFIRPKNLRAFSNNEYAEICIKQAKEVIRVTD